MPRSARAAALVAMLTSPAMACPGPDWTAPPYLGEVTFSFHNGASNLAMSGRAGGIFNLRDCGLDGEGLTGYRGDGLIRVRASLILHWYGEAPQMVVGTDFAESTLLLIHDPDGRWLFDDGEGHDPLIVISAPVVGDYAIFLGSHGTARFTGPGTLIISETRP